MISVSSLASKNSVLVCFAVPEEAKPFRSHARAQSGLEVVVTGMGARNAAQGLTKALDRHRPDLVLTCGFAGALRSNLPVGTVVYSEDNGAGLGELLEAAGGIPVSFHCATRVATTVGEKRQLRARTQADAVEMESQVIRQICQRQGILSATIRVISDGADQDLPLDFNALMTADDRIDFRKLAWALLRSPGKLPGLLRLQQQTKQAAQALADALIELLRGTRAR